MWNSLNTTLFCKYKNFFHWNRSFVVNNTWILYSLTCATTLAHLSKNIFVDKCVFKTYTMFSSYRIAISPFQFSYWIRFQFPLEQIFFGVIFVTERGWNTPILEVIRGVLHSFRSTQKPNGNTSRKITGYDFEFKWKQKTYNY